MTYKSEAIVLKSYNWPRSARLYVLYTKRFGKVKGVAAGVQKVKSKVAGHLQPFCITEVMMAQGRSVDRLAQARFVKGFPDLRRDYQSFLHGSYILELIESFTHEGVADQRLWDNIVQVFTELNERSLWGGDAVNHHLLTRQFALQLLDHFGYRPELYRCFHCQGDLQPDQLEFSLIQSATICQKCSMQGGESQSISAELLKLFRTTIRKPLHEASRVIVHQSIEDSAITLIDQMVGMQLQRRLRTVQIF